MRLLILSLFVVLPLLTGTIYAQDVQNQSNTQVVNESYTVQPGDSLSSIALTELGDNSKWTDIYKSNKSLITDPNIIFAGEVITVPVPSSISNTSVETDKVSSTNSTPTPTPNIGSVSSVDNISESIQSAVVPVASVPDLPAYSSQINSKSTQASFNPSAPKGYTNYASIINAAASQYKVSVALMNKILACESGFNPNAKNRHSDASGIAQFMPSTFYGNWNIYKGEGLWSAHAQIYAMALKISQGGVRAWVCASL